MRRERKLDRTRQRIEKVQEGGAHHTQTVTVRQIDRERERERERVRERDGQRG